MTEADSVSVESPLRRRAIHVKILLAVLAVIGAVLLTEYFGWIDWPLWRVKAVMIDVFYRPLETLFTKKIFTATFVIVLVLTLTLERLFPAEKNQKIFSLSFAQDLVWFFYEAILHALVIITYVNLIKTFYASHLNFLTIESLNSWPQWARFVLGVVLLDFLYWLQHILNHKVPMFWQFHAVHHSQKHLNFFTDFRYHVLEYVVRHTVLVIPFLLLKVDVPTIVAFSVFRSWYTRLYHGNIKTNLGPLRYILVTPQSHRIHHSNKKEHMDLNYGSLFSVWDFLFGTMYRKYDEYPETGIGDKNFPHEQKGSLIHLLLTPLVQMAYPVKVVLSWTKKNSRKQ